jgi:hypothetical protein
MGKAAGSLRIGARLAALGNGRSNANRHQQHSQAGKTGEETRHGREDTRNAHFLRAKSGC